MKETERTAFASWKSAFVAGHAAAENWARFATKLDSMNFDIGSDSECDFGSDIEHVNSTTSGSAGRVTSAEQVEAKNVLIADTDDEWEIATESSLLMDEEDFVEAD